MLIVDTEGFGGMDESINHDSRIFLFSLLISSYFIYNSVGSIDENALNTMSLIINLAKEIQLKNQNSKEEDTFFPSFLWIVRDFALKLQDSFGNSLTAKDYLERALDLQKGVSDTVENRNRIRRLFKHFFQERDCVTMVRPCESENKLQKLHSLKNNELRSEFIEEAENIRKKVFKKVKPKTMKGKAVNGSMLLALCKHFVEVVK